MLPPFIPNFQELRPFAAELWLVGTVVAVLLTPFFVRRPNVACGLMTLAGLAAAMICQIRVGIVSSPPRLGTMLSSDGVAFLWKVILLLFVAGVVVLWFTTTRHTMHPGDGPEFFTLLIGATLGMALMGEVSNLLMIFMAIEAASLPSYLLAGFRKTHRKGAEASIKYVLFGAVASAMMAYGLSLLYGLYGSLALYPSATDMGIANRMAQQIATGAASPLLVIAIFGLICGLGFKIAAIPFHFWCPDVFEGASIEVTTFLSVASKGAGLILLLRIAIAIADASGYRATALTTTFAAVVGSLGVVTCTVGNTAAYVQNNIKRLLAYSSIAHAGYMLCAVSLLVRHSELRPAPYGSAAQAILLYLAVYVFMNLGAFTVAALVAQKARSEDLSAFAGLGQRSPLLAACMTACVLSLIGLPPFAGFTAKFNIIQALVMDGGAWWILAAAIVINTILSAYYYARLLKAMYLKSSDEPRFTASTVGTALSTFCAAALVALFVGANRLTEFTSACSMFRDAACGSTLGNTDMKLRHEKRQE